ncbi:MAG: V-type ATPase subunit [Candidatus Kariarchaeaceae archaeon]
MSTEILMIGLGTGTVLALGAAIWKNAGQSSFLYANARMTSRTGLLLDNARLMQLANSKNLPELVNQLKDTEYYPFLEQVDKNSITDFNMAMEEGLIQSLNDIKEVSPKKFRVVFDGYFRFYESKIIKTFFRSRFSDVKIAEGLMEPMGAINPTLLKHLHDTQTIADIKLVLRDTEYAPLFEKEYETIEEFDLAIEKKLVEDIDRIIKKAKFYHRKIILDIFKKRVEIKKVLTLLKFRIRDTSHSVQEDMIEIEGVDVHKVVDAEDLKGFVKGFEGTVYESALKKGLEGYEKNENYFSFEKELLRSYHNSVIEKDLYHTIGPYPIISYFTKKEIEQKNLLILAKGVTSGLDKEELKEMII